MNYFDLSESTESTKSVSSNEPISTDESSSNELAYQPNNDENLEELVDENNLYSIFEVNHQNVQQKIEAIRKVYSKLNSELKKLAKRYRIERDDYSLLIRIVQQMQHHQEKFRNLPDFKLIKEKVYDFMLILNENVHNPFADHIQQTMDQVYSPYNEFNQIYQKAKSNDYEVNINQLDSNANQLFSIVAQFENTKDCFNFDLKRREIVIDQLKFSVFNHVFFVYKQLVEEELDTSSIIKRFSQERLVKSLHDMLMLLS